MRRNVFPPDDNSHSTRPPRPRWPIQPRPGEYALALLDRARQQLARTWFTAVLHERSNALTESGSSDE